MTQQRDAGAGHDRPYRSLAVQSVLGGVVMYLVMFVMIDGLGSFYNNLNMFYMTMMMVAPMVVFMILGMRRMFPSRTRTRPGSSAPSLSSRARTR